MSGQANTAMPMRTPTPAEQDRRPLRRRSGLDERGPERGDPVDDGEAAEDDDHRQHRRRRPDQEGGAEGEGQQALDGEGAGEAAGRLGGDGVSRSRIGVARAVLVLMNCSLVGGPRGRLGYSDTLLGAPRDVQFDVELAADADFALAAGVAANERRAVVRQPTSATCSMWSRCLRRAGADR